jgi:NAD(P)H dehydrogenase (quinone)
MDTKQILITYYSGSGNTKRMAEEIAQGATGVGVAVQVKEVEHCTLNEVAAADAIVVGSPTYFSNVAWQVKKLIDESITLYRRDRKLKDKVGGCFTSSGTRRDGEDCLRMLELAFGLHHQLKMVPGIIRTSDDSREAVSKMCREYGRTIAKLAS